MHPPAIIRTTTTAGAKEDESSSSQEDETNDVSAYVQPNDVSAMAAKMWQEEIHEEINNNPEVHGL